MSAGGLPPPPVRAANGDVAWVAWYNQLYTLLSTTGSVSWSLVSKAGSSIADLANHTHGVLSAVLGTGSYHISSAEATTVTALPNLTMKTKTTDPVAADIPASTYVVYKNTTTNAVKLWVNDGGTLKSVALV